MPADEDIYEDHEYEGEDEDVEDSIEFNISRPSEKDEGEDHEYEDEEDASIEFKVPCHEEDECHENQYKGHECEDDLDVEGNSIEFRVPDEEDQGEHEDEDHECEVEDELDVQGNSIESKVPHEEDVGANHVGNHESENENEEVGHSVEFNVPEEEDEDENQVEDEDVQGKYVEYQVGSHEVELDEDVLDEVALDVQGSTVQHKGEPDEEQCNIGYSNIPDEAEDEDTQSDIKYQIYDYEDDHEATQENIEDDREDDSEILVNGLCYNSRTNAKQTEQCNIILDDEYKETLEIKEDETPELSNIICKETHEDDYEYKVHEEETADMENYNCDQETFVHEIPELSHINSECMPDHESNQALNVPDEHGAQSVSFGRGIESLDSVQAKFAKPENQNVNEDLICDQKREHVLEDMHINSAIRETLKGRHQTDFDSVSTTKENIGEVENFAGESYREGPMTYPRGEQRPLKELYTKVLIDNYKTNKQITKAIIEQNSLIYNCKRAAKTTLQRSISLPKTRSEKKVFNMESIVGYPAMISTQRSDTLEKQERHITVDHGKHRRATMDNVIRSDMTKILMASALARMELTDQSKAALGHEGAIVPLVKMFISGKLEAKLAALGALQKLSTLSENMEYMINAGVVPPLLQLLFSVTSALVSLKEPAAAILANLVIANCVSEQKGDLSGGILESNDIICQLLSLLNLAGPVIQGHLLRALNGLACPSTAYQVRFKMREGGAIQLLLPFFYAKDTELRISALKLLFYLSQDGSGRELADQFGQTYIVALVKLLSVSLREDEKAAAVGILSNLPVNDRAITEMLLQANALHVIVSLLNASSTKIYNTLRKRHNTWEMI